MKKTELPNKLHEKITSLCSEGDALSSQKSHQDAYAKYEEAWNLVPEPKVNWEASTWILGAVGELQYQLKKYDKALNSYLRALQCPNGLANPYIHLRIGELQYELGKLQEAGDNLTRAYMGAGEAIFEDEDPKYFAYLCTILQRPQS